MSFKIQITIKKCFKILFYSKNQININNFKNNKKSKKNSKMKKIDNESIMNLINL